MTALHDIAEEIRRCTACPLWKNRTLAVPGEGKLGVGVVVLKTSPSEEDDRKGLPFQDQESREALKQKLVENGLQRKDVFLTTKVKCCPKGREATQKEIATCTKLWLEKQKECLQKQSKRKELRVISI